MQPIGGVMSVIEGKLSGSPATAGELYRGGVGAEEDYRARAIANTPGALGVATDVAGSLVGGGRSTARTGLGTQMLQAGGQGAIEGASNNAKDLSSAAGGAAVGGGVSAGTTGILGALLSRFKDAGTKKDLGVASRQGGSQLLEKEGGDIYKRLDAAGVHYSPRETAPLAGNIVQRLSDAGFNPNMHRQLIPAIEEIGGASGGRATWTQLQNMRTQISDLKASPDPRLRRMAGELGDELDNFISTARPTMPASSVAAGVNPAREVAEARDLWRRGSQASTVEALAEKGTRTATDPAAKVQKNFEKYSDKFLEGKKYNPNSPEQMDLINKIVEGSPKTAATAKGLEGASNSLMRYGAAGAVGGAALPFVFDDRSGIGSGVSGTGAATIGLGLLGKGGSKGLRDMIAERGATKVNDLLRNIATGQTAQAPNAYVPRDLLAKILASQDAARGTGHYVGSFVNEGK